MYSLHRSRASSPSVRSRPAETSDRAWPRSQPQRHRLLGHGSNAGTPRFLESPSHASATLYDSGWSGPTSPYRSARCCPRYSDHEDTRDTYFGTQYRGFGIRCLRFKWCVTAPACKTGFRLVVGHCREGVEPSGLQRKVSILYIGFPLSQVYPGATESKLRRSGGLNLDQPFFSSVTEKLTPSTLPSCGGLT